MRAEIRGKCQNCRKTLENILKSVHSSQKEETLANFGNWSNSSLLFERFCCAFMAYKSRANLLRSISRGKNRGRSTRKISMRNAHLVKKIHSPGLGPQNGQLAQRGCNLGVLNPYFTAPHSPFLQNAERIAQSLCLKMLII